VSAKVRYDCLAGGTIYKDGEPFTKFNVDMEMFSVMLTMWSLDGLKRKEIEFELTENNNDFKDYFELLLEFFE
jgi:hypothetical protein